VNEGGGAFAAPLLVGPGLQAGAVAAGDLDLDGRADLVLVDKNGGRVLLARRRAADTLEYGPLEIVDVGAASYPSHVAIADVDGDGATDLVVVGSRSAVFLGTGDGAFGPRVAFSPLGTRVLIADVDRDGASDVVSLGIQLAIHAGSGSGAFESYYEYGSLERGVAIASADFDADGWPDFAVGSAAIDPGRRLSIHLGRDRAVETCRRGNVNGGRGPVTDVLFVNDSTGGFERRLDVALTTPLFVFMASPPAAAGSAPFALYAWVAEPRRADARHLPYGIGVSCLPAPLTGGEPRPKAIWNNVPRSEARLGAPRFPSSPAPSLVLARPRGPKRPVSFFLQGIIADPGAPNGNAAVTNGVLVRAR
jgi:hypothetical protein